MNSRLNYSSLEDAWGLKKTVEDPDQITLEKQFNPEIKYNVNKNYKKPTENILNISSNEITKSIVEPFNAVHPVQPKKGSILKPCSLVEEHINKCAECRNKFQNNNTNIVNPDNAVEHFAETFNNITPNQKNLLVIILYGILVILISDLIIKEKND